MTFYAPANWLIRLNGNRLTQTGSDLMKPNDSNLKFEYTRKIAGKHNLYSNFLPKDWNCCDLARLRLLEQFIHVERKLFFESQKYYLDGRGFRVRGFTIDFLPFRKLQMKMKLFSENLCRFLQLQKSIFASVPHCTSYNVSSSLIIFFHQLLLWVFLFLSEKENRATITREVLCVHCSRHIFIPLWLDVGY